MPTKLNFTKKIVNVNDDFSFNQMSAMEVAFNESVTLAGDDFQMITELTSAAAKLGLDVSLPILDGVDDGLKELYQDGTRVDEVEGNDNEDQT